MVPPHRSDALLCLVSDIITFSACFFQIWMAADVFVRDLTCKRSDANASLSEELFLEMEQNIRHLVDSSLKAYLIQVMEWLIGTIEMKLN